MSIALSNNAQRAYVTKRVLENASRKAVRIDSLKAMAIAGYVITVDRGWLIRKDADGTISRLKKIAQTTSRREIILD